MQEDALLNEGRENALEEKRPSPFAHVPFSKTETWLLIGIILLATLLRVPTIGKFSFWFDELCTWKFSHVSTISDVLSGLKEDIHPPAYDFLVWAMMKVFGDSESVIRLPSAIFGIISIPGIVMLGRRLFNARAAFIAAAIAAVTPSAIYFGQEARSYSMTYFLSIATTICWVELYRQVFVEGLAPSRKRIALLAVLTVIANYTHYYADLLTGLQGIIFFGFCVKHRRGWSVPVTIAVVSVITLIPWAFFVKSQLANNIWWIRTTPWFDASAQYGQLLYGFWPAIVVVGLALSLIAIPRTGFNVFAPGGSKTPWIVAGLIWLACAAVVGKSWDSFLTAQPDWTVLAAIILAACVPLAIPGIFPQTSEKSRIVALLFVWFLVPFIIVQAVSVKTTPIYVNRYLHISVAAAYLLFGYGISRLRIPFIAQGLIALVVGMCTLYRANEMGFFQTGFREDWRGLAQKVLTATPAGQKPVVVCVTERKGVFQYYFHRFGDLLSVDVDCANEDDVTVGWPEVLDKKPQLVWVLGGHLALDKPVAAARMLFGLAKEYGIPIKSESVSGGQVQAVLFIRKDLRNLVQPLPGKQASP